MLALGCGEDRRRRAAAHLAIVPGSAQRSAPPRAGSSRDEYKPSNRFVRLHCKHPRPPSKSMFGKGQPQKWPGFAPPRSRKMPPLRGLLLLRRVHAVPAKFNRGGGRIEQPSARTGPGRVDPFAHHRAERAERLGVEESHKLEPRMTFEQRLLLSIYGTIPADDV